MKKVHDNVHKRYSDKNANYKNKTIDLCYQSIYYRNAKKTIRVGNQDNKNTQKLHILQRNRTNRLGHTLVTRGRHDSYRRSLTQKSVFHLYFMRFE